MISDLTWKDAPICASRSWREGIDPDPESETEFEQLEPEAPALLKNGVGLWPTTAWADLPYPVFSMYFSFSVPFNQAVLVGLLALD